MSTDRNTSDSYAPIVAELTFVTPDQIIDVPVAEFLESIEIELTAEGGWHGTMKLVDGRQGDYLELLTLSTGSDRRALFRFGWDRGNLAGLPVFDGGILKVTPHFAVDAVHLDIELVQRQVLVSVADKRPLHFPANMLASEIFAVIAADRGWKTTLPNGSLSIEETDGFLGEYAYRGESDIQFIQRTLLPQAVNKKGEHFRFFFDSDGYAHFHSQSYHQGDSASGSGRDYELAAEFVFAYDPNGEVLEFSPVDNVFESILTGGANSIFTGNDPKTGLQIQSKGVANQGVDELTPPIVGNAAYRPLISPDKTHAKRNILARDAKELQARSSAIWSQLSSTTFHANVRLRGTHSIRPMDFFTVRYIKKDGTDHYMSGLFQALNVHHSFGSGPGFETTILAIRTGTLPVDGSALIQTDTRSPAIAGPDTQSSDNPAHDGPQETFTGVTPKAAQV